MDKLTEIVTNIYKYWEGYDDFVLDADIKKCVYLVNLIRSRIDVNGIVICDIGGGWGAFSAACAAIGMKSILIDDFQDKGFFNLDDHRQKLHIDYGFIRVARDVIKEGIDFPPNSIDIFTTFDVMEHFHRSPKFLFSQIMQALRPGGIFILGVPNCVNLRKRITVPLGIGKWSSMDEWYEEATFRGHVREPDVEDLRYIARDMGLSDVEIFGRNWMGMRNQNRIIRIFTKVFNKLICLRPSLYSDIYLLGRKSH